MPELMAALSPARPGETLSVSGWAFEELSRRIVQGELAPASKITEEALVRELGVSRTPLREALKQLEELGLIVRLRNRTLRVAPLHSEELFELVRLREHIEGLAAYEVTARVMDGRASTEALREVVNAIADAETRLSGADRIDRIFDLGTLFHSRLVELSGLARVQRIHNGLQLALARYRLVNARDQRRLNHRSEEHRLIVDALEGRDPAAAEAAMRHHIREGLRAYATNQSDGAAVITAAPSPQD
jgi:DNA-binding GntR family transcriptional regulator